MTIREVTSERIQGVWYLRMTIVVTVSSTTVDDGSAGGALPATTAPTSTPGPTRRLLQAAAEETLDAKLSGVLSSVAGTGADVFAEAVAAGAEGAGLEVPAPEANTAPSAAPTTPTVDVVGGLITQLAAAITSYEEQYISISFRMSQAIVDANKVTAAAARAPALYVFEYYR